MITTLLIALATTPAHAEPSPTEDVSLADGKVKVKKDVVLVDGVEVATFRKDPATRGARMLVSMAGEDLLYFKWISEPFQYMEAYHPDDLGTLLFDAEADMAFQVLIARRLVKSGVLRKNGLDDEALKVFAQKAGTENTRRRRAMGL